MHNRQPLPTPSPEALQHSEQLRQLILQTIEQAGGSIPFRQFMQMALYQPGFGYYVAGQEKFGANGDFVTAPEISPLFSHCLANRCASILAESNTLLELGAGSGIMAADILQRLATRNALPEQYLILEPGTELRQRQRETLQRHCPQLIDRVQWLQHLPEHPIQGVIIANEVLDAMPVELFNIAKHTQTTEAPDYINKQINEQINEPTSKQTEHRKLGASDITLNSMHVACQQGELCLTPVALTAEQATHIEQTCLYCWNQYYATYRPQQPYQSEYNPALNGWVKSLGNVLEKGEILLIDYGYERSDYYRPERDNGTLLCHYRHHVHDQPLLWPGLQDISASVDFTAVAEAADNAGLNVSTYQTQADFLFNHGLEDLFNDQLAAHPEQQYQLAQQVRTLTLPAQMGERFKVMGLTKGFTSTMQEHTLAGFNEHADRRHRL